MYRPITRSLASFNALWLFVISISITWALPINQLTSVSAAVAKCIALRSMNKRALDNNTGKNCLTCASADGLKLISCEETARTAETGIKDLAPSTVVGSRPTTGQLSYGQTMFAGAMSRTIAQTLLHPANTYKTLLQLDPKFTLGQQPLLITARRLLRGIDSQFFLSLPHGAFHFFVIDRLKQQITARFLFPQQQRLKSMEMKEGNTDVNIDSINETAVRRFRWALLWIDFAADFFSSALATLICSVISTPQMVLTDRLMAGVYPSLPTAVSTILQQEGARGFYTGWFPALAQKIPSYGLTWMFFQQLKHFARSYSSLNSDSGDIKEVANFALGAIAAAMSVTVMIPMDTIKTRLVVQQATAVGGVVKYRGVVDCFIKTLRSEGVGALYRSLPPRLVSVVPMIAIQFGVYETMKSAFARRNLARSTTSAALVVVAPDDDFNQESNVNEHEAPWWIEEE